jgi:methyl-accepting chemotaxis protein
MRKETAVFKNATLNKKLMAVGIIITVPPLVVLAITTLIANGRMENAAAEGSRALAYTDLDHIAQCTYAMCQTQQELLDKKLSGDVKVAKSILDEAGPVSVGAEQVQWEAINQSTRQATRLSLGKVTLRDQWVGQNADLKQPSPVVDRVRELVGNTCTIFQRMNPAGDMLRVCTNVPDSSGARAIGTYIPAVEAGGQPNPVVAALLSGNSYTGRAFVVNAWYMASYIPIFNAQKEVIGAIYVGIPQESVTTLRKQIMATKVGSTGYIYVLDSKGNYIISNGGKRDGECIWEAKDADGKQFIQEIVAKARQLHSGEIAEQRYPWKNEGDAVARAKIARVMYFAPWDWVIGVGSYLDEFEGSAREVQALGHTAQVTFLGVGLGAMVVSFIVWFFVSHGLSNKITRLVRILSDGGQQTSSAAAQVSSGSQSLAQGAGEQAAAIEETTSSVEEMASMTKKNAANAGEAKTLAAATRGGAEKGGAAMARMSQAIEDIKKSSDSTAKIVKTIDEIAFQTNLLALNAAVEAARAGEAGKGFAVVAEEVRNLAQRSAEAAKNTASMIEESVKNAENGVQISKEVGQNLSEIGEAARKVDDLVGEIAAASNEQAQGIEQISTAINQMDTVTQQNAASAEESASASEELSAQAEELSGIVRELMKMVGGAEKSNQAVASGPANEQEPHFASGSCKASRAKAPARKSAGRPKAAAPEHRMPGGVASPARMQATGRQESPAAVIPMDESEELAKF